MPTRMLKDKQVKARKPHRCGWCGKPILKGEQCFHMAYVFDGQFNNEHMHSECHKATLDI